MQTGMRDYQKDCRVWLIECFGEQIANDVCERNHRFLEESLELVQSLGCTKDQVLQLVDYVYSRPSGDPKQEVGGVMTTVNSLASASGIDVSDAAKSELQNVWIRIDKIRLKRSKKPNFSPLP